MTDHHPERIIRYFEDYRPGAVVDCGSFTLSEAEIIAFATQYDPQPFHVDRAAASSGPFGGLIASGWHSTAMMMRHLVECFLTPESSLGSPGLDDLRWIRPVRPGDTLRVLVTVVETRRSASKPDRGIVKSRIELVSPEGEVALRVTANNLVLLRDPA
jgi:acyl dehydratase